MEANYYEIERMDPRFPASILELPSPPNKLYVRGNIELLNRPALSIIGARSASPYGLAIAEIAATIAAQSDICVVSGGAKGCDQAAGALPLLPVASTLLSWGVAPMSFTRVLLSRSSI